MNKTGKLLLLTLPVLGLCLPGCAAPKVDFSIIKRPPRAPQLDAYEVFVGKWDWTAEMLNTNDANKDWSGTAEWMWTLDKRALHGRMSARSKDAEFETAGIWSWHPKKKQYIWWLFNNWGYPQQGTAKHCPACPKCPGCWCMNYKSVGLDGTPSYGRYCLQFTDNDTIDWKMVEWADMLHIVKKIEMKGTYKRRK